MNVRRITYGGLTAAAVMAIGELAMEPLLGSTTRNFFARLALPMPGESAAIALVVTLIVAGWVSVCMYQEFAVRSGSGAVTAAQTGALVWLLSCLLPNVTLYSYGVADARFFWMTSAWSLASTVIATVIGAAVHDGRRRLAPAATR